MSATDHEPACIECVMAWLLYGDGAVCLWCQERVFWNERATLDVRQEGWASWSEEGVL